ncbi:MAG: ATP synthase F1 subunit delta [Bacteroidales bacterium]|jgi:F-type H+-transporting ATPase subunit delta|nr:ATP synthase F1 subunit delta [Bacteroidales bacterium]
MAFNIVSSRYARSLFDLSLERNVLDRINSDMSLINTLCLENPILNIILKNPNINIGKKKNIVKDLLEKRVDSLTLSFILLLIDKRRVILLKEIANEFVGFCNKYKGIKVATLISANKIDELTKQRIIKLFEKQFNCTIKLEEKENPSLLGGFKIMIEDMIYDASILNQLNSLKKSFAKNIYEKGY